jgi:transposase, IS5 family
MAGFERPSKRTRKREFLDEMALGVSWAELVALIAPHAPAAKTGRPPFPVGTMLRIDLLQQWFNLSDPAMEEAPCWSCCFTSSSGPALESRHKKPARG